MAKKAKIYPEGEQAPDDTIGNEGVKLNGHTVHVIEEFSVDDVSYVHIFIPGESTARVLERSKFDDQTGWTAPEPGSIEDPSGLDGLDSEGAASEAEEVG